MIRIYLSGNRERQEITQQNQDLLANAIWIDLLSPTKEEEDKVEKFCELDIPTRDEMREIEVSSRLYQENDSLFMTALMIANSDSPNPKLEPVTMILTSRQLVTIRYIEPLTFDLFNSRVQKMNLSLQLTPTNLLIELLDIAIDRLADILELVGRNLDGTSQQIFRSETKGNSKSKLNFRELLNHIGTFGDLNTKVRESLITFDRLIRYYGQAAATQLNEGITLRLTTFSKDIQSLSHHVDFLSTKVNFLLEATLGLVNIDQNNTIKIFSVAAVIFLPPTLIASIYGMNFKFMPELSWHLGYPFAIGLMIVAGWLPYKYFKRRGWL